MLSVSYISKNANSAGKTSGVLRVGASGANRCYVLAHCGTGPYPIPMQTTTLYLSSRVEGKQNTYLSKLNTSDLLMLIQK